MISLYWDKCVGGVPWETIDKCVGGVPWETIDKCVGGVLWETLDIYVGGVPWETITLTTLGRRKSLLLQMLEEAKADVLTRHEGTTSMYHCTGICTDLTWRNNFYVPLYRYMYWPDTKEQLLCTTVQVCTDLTWRNNFYVPLYRYVNLPVTTVQVWVLTRHEGKTSIYHCTGMYWPDMKEQLLWTTEQVYVPTRHERTTSLYHCTGMCTYPSPLYRYVLTRHEGTTSMYRCTGMYWPDIKEQLLCTTVQVYELTQNEGNNFYVPLYRYVYWPDQK